MKKLLSLFLLLALVLTVAGCGNSAEANTDAPHTLGEETVENAETPDNTESSPSSEQSSNDGSTSDSGLNSDFKTAMDSYEKFMDEYVAFMKKYKENPSDFSLLADYTDYMSKYADFVANFDKWANEDLNTAELAYYLEVQSRVTKKLLEVAQ